MKNPRFLATSVEQQQMVKKFLQRCLDQQSGQELKHSYLKAPTKDLVALPTRALEALLANPPSFTSKAKTRTLFFFPWGGEGHGGRKKIKCTLKLDISHLLPIKQCNSDVLKIF